MCDHSDVSFFLLDTHGKGTIGSVTLVRSRLNVSELGVLSQQVAPTGMVFADVPGAVTSTDTTIENATIDNSNFAYALRARVLTDQHEGLALGIRGARVTYRVTDV